MEIWSDGYSSYSNSRYYEAKNKFNENLEKAKACTNMVTLHSDSIKDRANFIKKNFVVGKQHINLDVKLKEVAQT